MHGDPEQEHHRQAKAKPAQSVSDRALFYRSSEVFAKEIRPFQLVITCFIRL
jgi:hypothetical protein